MRPKGIRPPCSPHSPWACRAHGVAAAHIVAAARAIAGAHGIAATSRIVRAHGATHAVATGDLGPRGPWPPQRLCRQPTARQPPARRHCCLPALPPPLGPETGRGASQQHGRCRRHGAGLGGLGGRAAGAASLGGGGSGCRWLRGRHPRRQLVEADSGACRGLLQGSMGPVIVVALAGDAASDREQHKEHRIAAAALKRAAATSTLRRGTAAGKHCQCPNPLTVTSRMKTTQASSCPSLRFDSIFGSCRQVCSPRGLAKEVSSNGPLLTNPLLRPSPHDDRIRPLTPFGGVHQAGAGALNAGYSIACSVGMRSLSEELSAI